MKENCYWCGKEVLDKNPPEPNGKVLVDKRIFHLSCYEAYKEMTDFIIGQERRTGWN